MTPNPGNETVIPLNEKKYSRVVAESDDEEIVITGMSGRFPNSRNVAEFEYNLYNKVDMVDDAETRWKHFNVEIPRRCGKLIELHKFDATFFGVNFKQAHSMDPQCRILVESAYEAIIDAGVNPKELRGTNTGVYIGACISESEKTWFYEKVPANGLSITGCSRAMLANRLSYVLGLHGPSYLVDTACSSSMYALDNAFTALRNGEIDAAIIGGTNLILHPYVTLQFARLGVLSKNGLCRPFDKDASGYTRSEAINCLFLQRKRNAKRIYATIVYSKTNCDGHKVEGITYPSGQMQEVLLKEFYDDCKISPRQLGYLEAHSTGTIVGDPEESKAIDNVLCSQRDEPLLVGSVKSNIGHSEAASGICSIVKVVLAFEKELVPPNINFTEIRRDIPALVDGRLKVVSEPCTFNSPYIGVNSFGFGGANAHALFKANDKSKMNHGVPADDIPRLVVWAGRTENAVHRIFNSIEGKYLDREYIALLNDIHKESTAGLVFRGYGLFSKGENGIAKCLSKNVQHSAVAKRPVVWVFSGLGSEWNEMGSALMTIPHFRQSIEKCQKILKATGLDLIKILTSSDPKVFSNVINGFVGITAIQIGLIDLLKTLNIEPDYIIGHSIGELCCGYADGGLTLEHTILAAYYRGKVCEELEKIKSKMVEIGVGYKKITKHLPDTIDIACHNSSDSCTIAGPSDDIDKFVSDLKSSGISAIEMTCSNVPYHSRYIAHMGPLLLQCLREIISNPVKRSSKWLSSSVPKSHWDKKESQYCSAEYYTNNLLGSVLFEEVISMLPPNSLTIEISPQGVLQELFEKSMPNGHHIELTQNNSKNNAQFLLESLGKVFLSGVSMALNEIYPKVEWPVSRGTPSICSLIEWNHNDDWFVTKFENIKMEQSGERVFKVNLQDDDEEYMIGHTIDGRILVPATAYLQYVWETFSLMYKGPVFMDTAVEFEDVKFIRATHLTKDTTIYLTVMIHYGTGQFEITESGTTVVTGTIREMRNPTPPMKLPAPEKSKFPTVSSKDFYKELRLRGYHYNGGFRSVEEARGDGLAGKVKWNFNWVTFMDCLLQIYILGTDSRSLLLPTKLRKLRIFGKHHLSMVNEMNPDEQVFDVTVSKKFQRVSAGGIEVIGLHASPVARRKPPGIPVLEKYEFLPHFPTPKISTSDAVRCCVQLALENIPALKMQIVELDNRSNDEVEPIISHFLDALEDLPLVSGEYLYLTKKEVTLNGIQIEDTSLSAQTNCTFVIAHAIISNPQLLSEAEKTLAERSYVVCRENLDFKMIEAPPNFELVGVFQTEHEILVLLQSSKKKISATPTVLNITDSDTEYSWIQNVQTAITKGPVILYAQNEKFNGLLGMVNCLRKEPDGNGVTCVFVDDPKAPVFDPELPFYKSQLKKGLAVNIFKHGQWGTYRHLQIKLELEMKPYNTHVYGNVLNRGDLSSMSWFQGPFLRKDAAVEIFYASLNFRDVMLASGRLAVEIYGANRLDQQCVLGFEFCGIDLKTNKRIMGMTDKAACASFLTYTPGIMWEVPKSWSWEDAATMPCVYSTVYYAFFDCTEIEKGKSILIHAGTGGIGLSAIRVALAYGLEVFTTVSTPQKKQFLLDTYPQLKESHIGNSRDTSFETMIQEQTAGKGVDYVLNSLSEDKLLASIRCLGKGGHFLEIGKFDMANDTKVGLGEFLKELTFHSVLADNLLTGESDQVFRLKALVDKDLANGIIQPLPRHVFKAHEIEQAFRFLASAKHMGKVIIQVRENLETNLTLPIKVIPQIYFKPDLVYIIPGGLGGFGLELADWLAIRGARKLVLSSSRGLTKSYQKYRIALWTNYKVETVINTDDITTRKGCESLIREALKMGPVGGIFNLAVALRDAIFINQTPEKFIECMAPKAIATKYLDELSRKLCPQLEHFVIFSSVSCGRGNAGQTNYGMANSIMEKIIEDRVAHGLPGKAIQWGAVGEVGLVADMAEDKIDMEIGGTLQQRISSCLQELDTLMSTSDALVSSMVVAEKRSGRGGSENIIETVMGIMGIRDLKSVSMGSSLAEMGMDSLMAVEIKQTLERDFELFLTPQDLRALTFQKLQEFSDAREKEGAENVKLKVKGGDDKQLGMNLLVRNLGEEKYCRETFISLNDVKPKGNSNPAIIMPGFESVCGKAWYELGKNLLSNAVLLQTYNQSKCTTVKSVIDEVFEGIKGVLKKSKTFHLIGYSYGTLLTLELASRLEKLGYSGKITIIDGSPVHLQKLLYGFLGENYTENDITNIFLTLTIANVFPEEVQDSIGSSFLEAQTYDDKIKKFEEYIAKQDKYSLDYSLTLIRTMVNRTKMCADSVVIDKLNSPVMLIRPTEASVLDIEEDYEYSKLTNGKVFVKFVEGNHTSMLDNTMIPQIINEFEAASA